MRWWFLIERVREGGEACRVWQMLACNPIGAPVFSRTTWVTRTNTSDPPAAAVILCAVPRTCACYVGCFHAGHMIADWTDAWVRDSQLSGDSHAKSASQVQESLSQIINTIATKAQSTLCFCRILHRFIVLVGNLKSTLPNVSKLKPQPLRLSCVARL